MGSTSYIDVLLSSGPIVSSIFLILVFMSIYTWTIVVAKAIQLRKEDRHDTEFLSKFNESKDLADLFETIKIIEEMGKEPRGLAAVFHESYQEIEGIENHFPNLYDTDQDTKLIKSHIDENIGRTLERMKNQERNRRGTFIGVLATTSNVAPFIGLLGTVIGIINAFHEIGRMGSADLAFVAPAISEALIATALGLFVAIPASVGFNYYKNWIQKLSEEHDRFCLIFQNKIQERYFFRKGQPNADV